MSPQDTAKNPAQTPADQPPAAAKNAADAAGTKMAGEVYGRPNAQVPERGMTPAEIAAERRARRSLPTTEAPPPANAYEQQQAQTNQNLAYQSTRSLGKNAPDDVKEFASTIIYPLKKPGMALDQLAPRERQLIHPEIYYPERARTSSYIDFKQKDYYPLTQPAFMRTNLSALTDWEESELFTIARGLDEAVLLNKGPNVKDGKGVWSHDKAKQIVTDLIPKMTWDQNAPKPVVDGYGVVNKAATETAYSTWVGKNLKTLETIKDNNADLVQINNQKTQRQRGTRYFEELRAALATDVLAQLNNPNSNPHRNRDAYLAQKEKQVFSTVISRSQADIEAKAEHDKQLVNRMANEVGQNNSIGVMHAKLSEAASTNDANQAKQLLEEAAKANPDFANWIDANNSNSQDLLYKLQAIRALLGNDPTKQVPVAVETCVTPDLLTIVEKQIKKEETTPAQNIFAAAVSRQIQHATTMSRNPKEPVEKTIARNVAGIERQLAGETRLYIARNHLQGRIDLAQMKEDIDKLMAPIRKKAGR